MELTISKKKVLIDDNDFSKIKNFKYWWIDYCGYVVSEEINKEKRKRVAMHRLILGFPKGKVIDHINRNRLDNRKCNLRICTQRENMFNAGMLKNNKSGFKGVFYSTFRDRWVSNIKINGISYILGLFLNKEDAIDSRKAVNNILEKIINLPNKEIKKILLSSKLRKDNKSGVRGVFYSKGDKRWIATYGKKRLGFFKNKNDAITIRKNKENE